MTQPNKEITDSNAIIDAFHEPGPPTENQNDNKPQNPVPSETPKEPKKNGFDDIFDNAAPAETPKNEKPAETPKSDEGSIEDQYYSPENYQDTGGYEDDGGDNYYQNNYYGGGSDYEEEDDKEYETYKRGDTNKDEKNVKKDDNVDFL